MKSFCLLCLLIIGSFGVRADAERTMQPVDLPGIRIHDAKNAGRLVRVRGVLDSVSTQGLGGNWYWALLRTPTIKVGLALPTSRFHKADLLALVNAELSVCGIVRRADGTPQSLPLAFGAFVSPRSKDDITVLTPAPDDPFAAPPFNTVSWLFRQRLSGTVEAVGRQTFVLTSDTGTKCLVSLTDDTNPPAFGDRVTIVGFAEQHSPQYLTMLNALVRTDKAAADAIPSAPTRLDDRLLSCGIRQLDVISARGRVATIVHDSGSISEITLVHSKLTLTADLSAIAADLDDVPKPGDEVEVCGAFISEDEQPTPHIPFPRLRSHLLLPRTPRDFTLLSRQSQWSQARVMSVVGTLAGVILLFFVFNHLLRRTVERRSVALFNEHAGRIRAETKVEERTRLSVELHDSVSQMLTGIALQIDAAIRANRGENLAVARFLDLGAHMLASCRKELQSCLWELRSRTFAERDMTEAVRKTIEPFVQSVRVQTRFNVPRDRFSESTAHAVLKTVRELVANAVRHGQAKSVRIAGECHGSTVRFSVRDDGRGFDAATAPGPAKGHFGLHGIRERLKSFKGALDVRSEPGHGTEVTVTLNINPEPENG